VQKVRPVLLHERGGHQSVERLNLLIAGAAAF
jgi:hypothetical protein